MLHSFKSILPSLALVFCSMKVTKTWTLFKSMKEESQNPHKYKSYILKHHFFQLSKYFLKMKKSILQMIFLDWTIFPIIFFYLPNLPWLVTNIWYWYTILIIHQNCIKNSLINILSSFLIFEITSFLFSWNDIDCIHHHIHHRIQ